MSCPKNTTPQDTNLDCITTPEELEPFLGAEFPEQIQAYAKTRQSLLKHRAAGQSEEALKAEAECARLYLEIPDQYSW